MRGPPEVMSPWVEPALASVALIFVGIAQVRWQYAGGRVRAFRCRRTLGRSACDAKRARFRASQWWPPPTKVCATTLIVVEPQATPAELLSQNTILFAKVVDDLQLTFVYVAGDGDQHESEWIQHSRHVGYYPSRALESRREFKWIQHSDHTGDNSRNRDDEASSCRDARQNRDCR